MTRKTWRQLFLLLGSVTLLVTGYTSLSRASNSNRDRPNVVVIVSDDQGWGDLSLHGNDVIDTPNIDALARGGARFQHFYVQPVCSPTRAELLTGRYHSRGGVYSTSAGGERLDLDEHTIAETFRKAGYATAAFGKWHNGTQYPYHPLGRGFETFFGFTSGHWGQYVNPTLEQNMNLVDTEGYIVNTLTDRALEFIQNHRDDPFFCYLPYNIPHSPMQVPDRFFEKFKRTPVMGHRYSERENVVHTRAALAMCENIDWNVGRITSRLEELGLSENTIVVYISDNGPNGWRWNANYRGKKGSTDEGGVRVPGLIHWPKEIEPGTVVRNIAGAIDLFPTLTDLAGVRPRNEKPFDGKSLKPLLTGAVKGFTDRKLYAYWNGKVSVRTQQFRLDHKGRLYDITRDPEQRHDVSDRHPEIQTRLQTAANRFKLGVASMNNDIDRPFPVGFPSVPVTFLPARDGVAHGTIRRSNQYPNASFFEHWTSTDDRITWDVRVNESGRYRAEVYYTCAQKNLGTVLRLSFGNRSVRKKVTNAHDPPLQGKKHDRVPRQESYVKDFRPITLGTIRLATGRNQLVLEAPTIPGEEAVDVRYVKLTLLTD